jgi:GNAT superfamily N-acetyltransferase
VTIRDLGRDFDPELFARFHREVLAPTFTADELESAVAMEEGVRGGSPALVAVSDGGEVAGGLVAERYPPGVLLVGYLAVREELRGGGIGRRLVERLRAECEADAGVRLAVGEVHDPRHWGDGGGAERPLDRLRFFEGAGARVLDAPFVQPALRPGSPRVPGFLLLALYADRAFEAERSVPSELLAGFVRDYYGATEGAEPPYDAELEALLGRIERDGTVGLLPVADYERVSPG